MEWWTLRITQLHKKLTALRERKREAYSAVAYPKPIELKAAVVQTSGPSGDEVLDYIIRAEEIDAQIRAIEEEIEALQAQMDAYLPRLTEKEQAVLRLRFYDFATWPAIAKIVYGEITEANIYKARKIKKNAVRKLSGKLSGPDPLTKGTPQV